MKICPTCERSFVSEDIYCPDDGATLSGGVASAFNTPTQVINTPQPVGGASASAGNGPLVYALVGGMTVTIFGLLIAVYLLSGGQNEIASGDRSTPGTTAKPVNSAKPAASDTNQIEPSVEPMTDTAARDVLDRWRDSQNRKNFGAYQALYHPSFIGYKVTPAGEQDRQGYAEWIRDRRKMVTNFINVQAENERISLDGEIAVIKFTQRWRSARHCDIGEKEITIQMSNGLPKIRSEIIRNPYDCP